ncbi:MAG TPA: hypothetical protein VKB10_07720 [Gaiellaceae bacterium]|nr:hypothetical protein [Gaiellaceae bacterium]
MRARAGLGSAWVGVTAMVVLAARSLAYSLAEPTGLAQRLEGSAGGPRLAVLAPVAIGIAGVLSTAVVWVVAVGVRERQRLHARQPAPRVSLLRLGLRSAGLFVFSSIAFALFESYLHWRAGVGFHGLACVLGPVHRDAVPLLAALALVAAALAEAVQHVVAWLRATLVELCRPLVAVAPLPGQTPASRAAPRASALSRLAQPRAPPLPA